MEFYIYKVLTFRVTAATNTTSDFIITKPLPFPFHYLFFTTQKAVIINMPQKVAEIQNSGKGSTNGYSK